MFRKAQSDHDLSPLAAQFAQADAEWARAFTAAQTATPGSTAAEQAVGPELGEQLLLAVGLADAVLAAAIERRWLGGQLHPKKAHTGEYVDDIHEALNARKHRTAQLADHWQAAGIPRTEISRRMVALHVAMQDRAYLRLPTSMLWDQNDPHDFWGNLSKEAWDLRCLTYDQMTPEQRSAEYY
jgi:hypothetical protein